MQRAAPSADPFAAQREAFLTAERARRRDEDGDYSQPDHYDNTVNRQETLRHQGVAAPAARKSMMLAYVLWWFAYAFSAHRFYLGETRSAIQQCAGFLGGLAVLLLGIATDFGILKFIGVVAFIGALFWMVLDVFFIPGMCRRANSAKDAQHRIFE